MARKNKKIAHALYLATTLSGTCFFSWAFTDAQELTERQREIASQKEHWRPFIEKLKEKEESPLFDQMEKILREGSLVSHHCGSAGVYFLLNPEGVPRFVIKPVDEHIFCLNNPEENDSLYNDVDHRVREGIPLYRSAQTDAACWEIATLSGLPTTTPMTVMAIVDHLQFYTHGTDKEKLCSVQEYLPHAQKLDSWTEELLMQGLTPEEIGMQIDQSDFEEACLFIWLIYDTDANSTNFCIFEKSSESSGGRYGLKKIDNDLSLPEQATGYFNVLAYFPNALLPASAALRGKITGLPIDKLLAVLEKYELSLCKELFLKRLELLQTEVQTEGITLAEMDELIKRL